MDFMSYIDDLLGAEIGAKAQQSFDTMYNLLLDLNIPISKSKLPPPTTKIVYLGIHVDSENATLSIPVEKSSRHVNLLSSCRTVLGNNFKVC